MNKAEANSVVEWFGGLYPTLSPEQGCAVRDAIGPFTVADFEAAAKEVFAKQPFTQDAIVELLKMLRAKLPATAVSMTQAYQAQAAEAARQASLQEERDRAQCAELSDTEYLDHAAALASVGKIPLYDDLKQRGRLRRSPLVRGLVAARVRALREKAEVQS